MIVVVNCLVVGDPAMSPSRTFKLVFGIMSLLYCCLVAIESVVVVAHPFCFLLWSLCMSYIDLVEICLLMVW